MVDDPTMNLVLLKATVKRLAPRLEAFARERGHPRGPALQVIQIPEVHPPEDFPHRFTAFTNQAAPLVRSLLMRDAVETCGVTWGFMLWDLSIGLRSLGYKRRSNTRPHYAEEAA